MSASQYIRRSLTTAAAISLLATTTASAFMAAGPAEAASTRWCTTSGTGNQSATVTCHGSTAKFYAKVNCQKKVLWWFVGPTYDRTGPKVKAPYSSMAVCNAGDRVTHVAAKWVS